MPEIMNIVCTDYKVHINGYEYTVPGTAAEF